MKKIGLAVLSALLVINFVLMVMLVRMNQQITDNGTTIMNTVNGYTTDITDMVDTVKSSLVEIEVDGYTQSGMIYAVSDRTSYIFTTSENAMEDSEFTVIFASGYRIAGQLVGKDGDTNLLLLEVTTSFNTTAFSLGDSSILNNGEYVVGLGGPRENGISSTTFGVAGTIGSDLTQIGATYACEYIETDLAVNRHNKGGPLVNLSGQLIGMLSDAPINGTSDMGYAITVNEMKRVYRQLRTNGEITRGSLPVYTRSIAKMESYEKNQLNISLDMNSGVLVTGLMTSGDDNPFKVNDVIVSIDSQIVEDVDGLKSIYYDLQSEDTVNVEIIRDGESQQVSVVLQ